MATKAFGYLRVSSTNQTKGHGLDRQREDVQAYADANGYKVVQFFEDAYTGTEGDRPAFVEMLAALMSNGTRTVIIESMDRLARTATIQGQILAKLAAEGITLIAANTGENVTEAISEDPMRKAMVQIQGVFAELDKSLIVRKLRKAREAKRKELGRCEGRKPYGDREGEAEIVARIKELRKKRRGEHQLSYQRVADVLNTEGRPTRYGGAWKAATVQNIAKRS